MHVNFTNRTMLLLCKPIVNNVSSSVKCYWLIISTISIYNPNICSICRSQHKPKNEDSLSLKEITLDKQPQKRLSKANLKALKKRVSSPTEQLLSDSDHSDASMEVCNRYGPCSLIKRTHSLHILSYHKHLCEIRKREALLGGSEDMFLQILLTTFSGHTCVQCECLQAWLFFLYYIYLTMQFLLKI